MDCGTLVLAEHLDDKLSAITLQLISKGRDLADKLGTPLGVLLLGFNVQPLAEELKSKGVDKIFAADHPLLQYYNPEIYTKVLCKILTSINPRLVLLGYTFSGIELGPAVATTLGFQLASNCVDLELSDGSLVVTRPIYRGLSHVKIAFQAPSHLMVSMQQGALSIQTHPPRNASVCSIPVQIEEGHYRTKVVELISPSPGEVDITQANIIVAVGRGIKDKANIQLAKDLADALGGMIACSRPLTDIGWLPLEYQVGMSGKTVNPKVYIACGISGASHHLMGMKDAGLVIAINNDPNAPIFQVAHCGVVADIFEILPALIGEARIRE